MIATVGVSDLAPAWLDQLAPGGRIVVPLDLRGSQRSVAFEWDGECWQSRSVVACGFMRMRGSLAGPERTQVTRDDQELALTLPDGRDVGIAAVAHALAGPAGPAAERATRVMAGPAQLFDGLGLWLALNEPRWGLLSESAQPPGGPASGLARAPVLVPDRRITAGIFEEGSFAILAGPDPRPGAGGGPRAGGPGGAGGAAGSPVPGRPAGWSSRSACSGTARPRGPGRRAGQCGPGLGGGRAPGGGQLPHQRLSPRGGCSGRSGGSRHRAAAHHVRRPAHLTSPPARLISPPGAPPPRRPRLSGGGPADFPGDLA